jgi:hypothetical protein
MDATWDDHKPPQICWDSEGLKALTEATTSQWPRQDYIQHIA